MEFRTSADHHSKLQNGRVSAPGAAEPAHILPYRRARRSHGVSQDCGGTETAAANRFGAWNHTVYLRCRDKCAGPRRGTAGDRHLPEGRTDKHPSSG